MLFRFYIQFPNLGLRDVDSLGIDHIGLDLNLAKGVRRSNFVDYDDVVVAKQYIGPMKRR